MVGDPSEDKAVQEVHQASLQASQDLQEAAVQERLQAMCLEMLHFQL
jgi:hypothetical protein